MEVTDPRYVRDCRTVSVLCDVLAGQGGAVGVIVAVIVAHFVVVAG